MAKITIELDTQDTQSVLHAYAMLDRLLAVLLPKKKEETKPEHSHD